MTTRNFVIKIGKFEFFISIEFIYYFVETLILTKSRIHEFTLPILRWLRAEQGQNQSTAHKEHIMHAKLRTFERKSFLLHRKYGINRQTKNITFLRILSSFRGYVFLTQKN